LFECKEYYSEFQALEVTRHTPLTNKMGLYFYELGKLPEEITADDMRLLWLMLFKADTKEELAKIESMEVPVMEQAIKAYHQEGNLRPAGSVEVQITAESEFRERERLYSIARHNEAAALRHARDEGRTEGRAESMEKVAQKMKEMGLSKEQIQTTTRLSLD
jgi:hypothetical protein